MDLTYVRLILFTYFLSKLHKNTVCSVMLHWQELESGTSLGSINRWKDNENAMYIYNEFYSFGKKNEVMKFVNEKN